MTIKHWVTGRTLFGCEAADTREALEKAVADGADLTGAALSGARLTGARLTGAVLTGAVLTGAVLSGAVLTGADLTGAVLTGADLSGARLTGADLAQIRSDLESVLAVVPAEVPGLLAALREGRVDGSTYQGDCACLVGTIANARHCGFREVPGLLPNSRRPAERWFLAIRPGDTPATNPVAAVTEGWITEWLAGHAPESVPAPALEP